MIRPPFPPFYKKSQLPEPLPNKLVSVVHDSWKVGDLVDWWYEGCYWSGKITRLLGDDNVEVFFNLYYLEVSSHYIVSDLCPSFDFSF